MLGAQIEPNRVQTNTSDIRRAFGAQKNPSGLPGLSSRGLPVAAGYTVILSSRSRRRNWPTR
jgi:hypothetical protein